MALTPTRQRNAVSEGTALGLLMCGRHALSYDKIRIDLAFSKAWQSWRHRTTYPQVSTDLAKGLDGVRAMTRADEGKHVFVLYWAQDGSALRINARQSDWTPEDPADLKFAADMIDGGVSPSGWRELAQAFLTGFDRPARS